MGWAGSPHHPPLGGLVGGVNGFIMTVMGVAEPLERAAELRGAFCVAGGGAGGPWPGLRDRGAERRRKVAYCSMSAPIRQRRLACRRLRTRCSELTRDYPFGVARSLFEAGLVRAEQEMRDELMRGPAALAEPVFGHR